MELARLARKLQYFTRRVCNTNVMGRPAGPQSVSGSHLTTAFGGNRTLTEGKEHAKRSNLDACSVWRASKYPQKVLWTSTNFDDFPSSKNAFGSHLDAILWGAPRFLSREARFGKFWAKRRAGNTPRPPASGPVGYFYEVESSDKENPEPEL